MDTQTDVAVTLSAARLIWRMRALHGPPHQPDSASYHVRNDMDLEPTALLRSNGACLSDARCMLADGVSCRTGEGPARGMHVKPSTMHNYDVLRRARTTKCMENGRRRAVPACGDLSSRPATTAERGSDVTTLEHKALINHDVRDPLFCLRLIGGR